MLGHSHTIFNKFDNKGKKKPRDPESSPMKVIKSLTDVLSRTRWRQEQECADLRHLTDDQVLNSVICWSQKSQMTNVNLFHVLCTCICYDF